MSQVGLVLLGALTMFLRRGCEVSSLHDRIKQSLDERGVRQASSLKFRLVLADVVPPHCLVLLRADDRVST